MFFRIFHGNWRGPGQKEEKTVFVRVGVDFRHYLHQFKGARLHVFMCIMLHMNEDGISFPSYDVLAKETGYKPGTISSALKELCEMKVEGHPVLMRWRERDDKGQYTGANQYKVFPTQEEIQIWENRNVGLSECGKTGVKEEPLSKENPKPKDKPKQQQTDVVVGSTENEQAIKSWTKRVPAIHEKTWRIWLEKHPRDWIEERVKWYEWQKRQKPRTATGWLVNAIREEWAEPPRGYDPDELLSSEERDDNARQRWLDYGKKLEAEGLIEPDDRPAPEPPPPPKPGEDTWRAVRDDLQRQLPRETFNTWLKDCVFAGQDGHRYTLTSDNKYAVEWLRHRLLGVMNKTLRLHTEDKADEFQVIMAGISDFEAAAAAYNERHDIEKPPAKPGEPDARLGAPAPRTAELKETA